ncbi:hypothetical protein [Bacillus pseudomycoides]|uniref:hypothetical protein n=1 Tax=Bacillus pseudomycoides TaxID=64104 RepID=UPI0014831723|nr:hypothetical protein [Bacillus pseudomycoides]
MKSYSGILHCVPVIEKGGNEHETYFHQFKKISAGIGISSICDTIIVPIIPVMGSSIA